MSLEPESAFSCQPMMMTWEMHDPGGVGGRGWGRSQLLPQNSITSECKLLYVPMLGLYHFTQLAPRRGIRSFFYRLYDKWMATSNPKIDNVKFSCGCHKQSTKKRPYPLFIIIITLLLILDYKGTSSTHQCIM
jgi:hypothetical protein